MERFLIIRTSSLGDIVHTLPALAALRKRRPGAEIRWVVESKGRAILEWVSGLDKIIVKGRPGWRKAMRRKDQTALDFQGLLKSGLVAFLSRSGRRVGFHRLNLKEPLAGIFYTDRAPIFPETDHVIRKNCHLLSVLGIETLEIDFALTVPETEREAIRSTLRDTCAWDGRRRIALFNVGAAWPTKRWPAERWSEVIQALAQDAIFPLLLWGTDEEREIASAVNFRTGTPLVPFLTLPQTLALIRESALLVSGDTFALQAAGALDVPVVGLFGPTNPRRNGPFRERDGVVYHPPACGPCYKRACRPLDCMKAVTAPEVIPHVRRLLDAHD